jgi:DNA mismatch repair protein MutS2
MGFDEATLEPTYVLRTGMPGKSAGLDIATRIGIPAAIIERARLAMSTRERDLAHLLDQLQVRLTETAAQAAQLERQEQQLAARRAELERAAERTQAQKLQEMEQRAAEATARFDAQAREMMATLLARTERRKDAERVQVQSARLKREFQESIQSLTRPALSTPATHEIHTGSRVRLRDVRELAHVRKVLPSGALEVDLGMLKMEVPVAGVLEVLPPGGQGSRLPSGVSLHVGPRWDTLTREINVIGRTAEEALDLVDKFLDTALLAEVARLRIIHGHGQGILRKTIQQWLAKHPAVEKYYSATPQEGGTGATIVELKGS